MAAADGILRLLQVVAEGIRIQRLDYAHALQQTLRSSDRHTYRTRVRVYVGPRQGDETVH